MLYLGRETKPYRLHIPRNTETIPAGDWYFWLCNTCTLDEMVIPLSEVDTQSEQYYGTTIDFTPHLGTEPLPAGEYRYKLTKGDVSIIDFTRAAVCLSSGLLCVGEPSQVVETITYTPAIQFTQYGNQ